MDLNAKEVWAVPDMAWWATEEEKLLIISSWATNSACGENKIELHLYDSK